MESYQKHVNGLTDSNKMKRCASYKQLSGLVKQDPTLFPKKEAFDLIRTCLKGFEDPSERCREEAISIVNELVSSQDANVLDWVLPSVVTRIGITPVAENSEELRLHLLKLASKCMSAFPHEIGPRNFMDFFQVLLENCLSDPYPDLKKEACRIVVQLCQIEPQQVKAIATPIAQAIKKSCLLHKHSSVRSEAVDAFGVLIRHGATSVLSEKSEAANNATEAQLYILANDHSEPVRIAVLNVLSHILLGINERLEYHKKYFPHVLVLSTDSFESVQKKAEELLNDIGKLYLLDNEDNRIDMNSRRITMKDIEWYADDEYPNMHLSSVDPEKYAILRKRPSLGTRYAVAEATRGFLDRILEDVTAIDWVIPFSMSNKRVMALRILWVTILHNEKSSVQFTERILSSLYKALRDENNEVREETNICVEILGKFLTPEQYLPFLISKSETPASEETTIVEKTGSKVIISKPFEGGEKTVTPTLFSTAGTSTKCSILKVLGYFILGSKDKLTNSNATQIVVALTSEDLIGSDTEDLLCSLIECFNMIFPVFAEMKFFPSPENPLPKEVEENAQQRTLDSIVFYALLRVKASPLPSPPKMAADSIAVLSTTVTGDPEGIYDLHVSRILARHAYSMPAAAFSDLVLTASFNEQSGKLIVSVLVDKLEGVDFTMRVTEELRYFAVLERLLHERASFSVAELGQLLTRILIPLGSFQPGQVAHLFRKIAVNCLCTVSSDFYREKTKLALDDSSVLLKIPLIWCSASDSDDGEMRLICMLSLPDICKYPSTAGASSDIVQSIILRFDDSSDVIRLRTAEGLLKVLKEPSEIDSSVTAELVAQAVPLTKKILIYLDDDEESTTQQVLKEVLVGLGCLSPNIVVDLTRSARTKHRDPTLCDEVIQSITHDSE